MTITIPPSALPWLWFGLGWVSGFLTLMLVAFVATRKPKASCNSRKGAQ